MSWPHAAYLTGCVLLGIGAVATAWRSARTVEPTQRAWTRAWRICLTALAAGPSGWLVPLGAIYVIARYHRAWRTAPEPSA